MNNLFTTIPNRILEADKADNLDLSLSIKLIWWIMYVNYTNHADSNMAYSEGQDSIAYSVGVDRKTVMRAIAKLVQHGFVKVGDKEINGVIGNNTYTHVSNPLDSTLYHRGNRLGKSEYYITSVAK